MEKIKQRMSKWNWEKIAEYFQYGLFAFVIINFLVGIGSHALANKLTEADGVRLGAALWVGNAWWWYYELTKKRKQNRELLTLSLEQGKKLIESTEMNKALIQVLDRIDKRVLAKHGISITVEKKGRTVN